MVNQTNRTNILPANIRQSLLRLGDGVGQIESVEEGLEALPRARLVLVDAEGKVAHLASSLGGAMAGAILSIRSTGGVGEHRRDRPRRARQTLGGVGLRIVLTILDVSVRSYHRKDYHHRTCNQRLDLLAVSLEASLIGRVKILRVVHIARNLEHILLEGLVVVGAGHLDRIDGHAEQAQGGEDDGGGDQGRVDCGHSGEHVVESWQHCRSTEHQDDRIYTFARRCLCSRHQCSYRVLRSWWCFH